jgi:hypothetical protein
MMFSSGCARNGYAQALEDLAMPPQGSSVGFISPDLSKNGITKSGYVITLRAGDDAVPVSAAATTCNGSQFPTVSAYFAEAHPVTRGTTGQRSFATDTRGTIYYNNTGTPIQPGMLGASLLQ